MTTKKHTKKLHKKKPVCLALQGGGAYGAFTWGVLDKLLADDRLEVTAISATSAGSVNAVVLAYGLQEGGVQGARDMLADFWNTLSQCEMLFNPIREMLCKMLPNVDLLDYFSFLVFEAATRIFSPYVLNPFNYNLLRNLLLEKIDFKRLKRKGGIQLFLCATNVKTGKLKIFNNKDLSVDAVLASACVPHLYQAVEVDNEYYWDGGFLGNPAIFPLIYHSEINDIIIVHTNPIARNDLPTNSTEITNRVNEIGFNSTLMRELRVIAFVTNLLNEGWIKPEYEERLQRKFIHMLRADAEMQVFSLPTKYNWHGDSIQKLYNVGLAVAEKWLADYFQDIGKKSTVDFNEFL